MKNLNNILNKSLKSIKYAGLILLIPAVLNIGIYSVAYFQESLNRQEAQKIIQTECSRLRIDKNIHLQITDKGLPHNLKVVALKHPNPKEYIIATNEHYLKRTIIRHELLHVAAHSNSLHRGGKTIDDTIENLSSMPKTNFFQSLYNYLIPESQANIYSLTGIQLF